MMTSLDPHSSYLNKKNFREMQVQTKGEFGGLGIEVTMENGYVKVVSPIDDTPAFRAGLKAGDLITHIDRERSEEHTSEIQTLISTSYAVLCMKKQNTTTNSHTITIHISK